MIPSAFVLLDTIPTTATGKIDRRALPARDQNRPELEDVYQAPRTSIEDTLASIWAELLEVNKVGIHDNFFEPGGHSLLATQIVSRIRSAFSIDLTLRTLFELPTVAEMAAIITQNQTKRASKAELAQMLREVEAITEKEAQKQLSGESAQSASGDRHE